ncbi:hypothetical protein E2C01_042828 [Portunus trituberculatus]|uniref:Uncharacterized protein n=1 Tax=Portunus trituberculatus TaxID=210409 RepID=A0A5B7FUN5_PORTR|nr:hypothetical protein [Portunus trituberculatus]
MMPHTPGNTSPPHPSAITRRITTLHFRTSNVAAQGGSAQLQETHIAPAKVVLPLDLLLSLSPQLPPPPPPTHHHHHHHYNNNNNNNNSNKNNNNNSNMS